MRPGQKEFVLNIIDNARRETYHAVYVKMPVSKSRLFLPSRIISRPMVSLISRPSAFCYSVDFEDIAMIHSHRNGRSRRSSWEVVAAVIVMNGEYCIICPLKMSKYSSASSRDGSSRTESAEFEWDADDPVPDTVYEVSGLSTGVWRFKALPEQTLAARSLSRPVVNA